MKLKLENILFESSSSSEPNWDELIERLHEGIDPDYYGSGISEERFNTFINNKIKPLIQLAKDVKTILDDCIKFTYSEGDRYSRGYIPGIYRGMKGVSLDGENFKKLNTPETRTFKDLVMMENAIVEYFRPPNYASRYKNAAYCSTRQSATEQYGKVFHCFIPKNSIVSILRDSPDSYMNVNIATRKFLEAIDPDITSGNRFNFDNEMASFIYSKLQEASNIDEALSSLDDIIKSVSETNPDFLDTVTASINKEYFDKFDTYVNQENIDLVFDNFAGKEIIFNCEYYYIVDESMYARYFLNDDGGWREIDEIESLIRQHLSGYATSRFILDINALHVYRKWVKNGGPEAVRKGREIRAKREAEEAERKAKWAEVKNAKS